MNKQLLRRATRNLFAAAIVAALLGIAGLSGAAAEDKKPPERTPPNHNAPGGGAPHGPSGGGASNGPAGGGASHGPSGDASRGPNAGGSGSHGPAGNESGGRRFGANDGGVNHGPATNGPDNRRFGSNDGGVNHGPTTNGPDGRRFGPNDGGVNHGPATNGPDGRRFGANDGDVNHGPAANRPGGDPFNHQPGGDRFNHGPDRGQFNHGPNGANHPVFDRPAPRGSNEHITRSGDAVRMRPGGRVSDIHDARRGIDIHHNMGGGRRVIVDRPDHSRVFVERGRPGFVERGYRFRDHDFGRRSYFYQGHEYHRYYRDYGFRGLHLNVYAPGYYYRPAFYGWAYHPWGTSISFHWGWGGNPWYGHYGYYFQPSPVYSSAAFWLTDYMIAQDLQAAYAAHQEAGEDYGYAPAQASGQPVLTPEVKQLIADEVNNQLALENQEAQQNAQQLDPDPASSGIARLLSDGRPHVFVAGGNLDVTDMNGQECVVSDGDTLQLREAPPADATSANLVVLSSKGRPECQISLTVQVQLSDLQEMQNHMRETIDQGLKELQDKQGSGGLPAAPQTAQGAPIEAMYASAAPPPEANLSAELQQQDRQSEQAENDVTAEPVSAQQAPASVEIGQTIDQVQTTFGMPSRVANLGPKVIYYYDGMKVIFMDGRVSDVE